MYIIYLFNQICGEWQGQPEVNTEEGGVNMPPVVSYVINSILNWKQIYTWQADYLCLLHVQNWTAPSDNIIPTYAKLTSRYGLEIVNDTDNKAGQM